MAVQDFEVASINLAGLRKVLVARGLFDAALARCGDETRRALDDLHSKRWHPGRVAVDIWGSIIDTAGASVFSDVQHDLTASSFGPIVTPLLKVGLLLGGRSPNTLLSRLDDAVKVGVKHVAVSWRSVGPTSSDVIFEYPAAPSRTDVIEHGWKGTLRFGQTLVDKTFTFAPMVVESERRFALRMSW